VLTDRGLIEKTFARNVPGALDFINRSHQKWSEYEMQTALEEGRALEELLPTPGIMLAELSDHFLSPALERLSTGDDLAVARSFLDAMEVVIQAEDWELADIDTTIAAWADRLIRAGTAHRALALAPPGVRTVLIQRAAAYGLNIDCSLLRPVVPLAELGRLLAEDRQHFGRSGR
jgi:hypothetical protein